MVALLQELEPQNAGDWQRKLCDLYAWSAFDKYASVPSNLTTHGMSYAYCPRLLWWSIFNTMEKTSLETEINSRLLIWALFTIALCKRNSL
jgi:succinate-acetate transporter protein